MTLEEVFDWDREQLAGRVWNSGLAAPSRCATICAVSWTESRVQVRES